VYCTQLAGGPQEEASGAGELGSVGEGERGSGDEDVAWELGSSGAGEVGSGGAGELGGEVGVDSGESGTRGRKRGWAVWEPTEICGRRAVGLAGSITTSWAGAPEAREARMSPENTRARATSTSRAANPRIDHSRARGGESRLRMAFSSASARL
jgi:hypothetical protein